MTLQYIIEKKKEINLDKLDRHIKKLALQSKMFDME